MKKLLILALASALAIGGATFFSGAERAHAEDASASPVLLCEYEHEAAALQKGPGQAIPVLKNALYPDEWTKIVFEISCTPDNSVTQDSDPSFGIQIQTDKYSQYFRLNYLTGQVSYIWHDKVNTATVYRARYYTLDEQYSDGDISQKTMLFTLINNRSAIGGNFGFADEDTAREDLYSLHNGHGSYPVPLDISPAGQADVRFRTSVPISDFHCSVRIYGPENGGSETSSWTALRQNFKQAFSTTYTDGTFTETFQFYNSNYVYSWRTALVEALGTGTLTVPDRVKTLSDYAFGYTNLSAVVLPATLNRVGDFVFTGCNNLTKIEISEENTRYATITSGGASEGLYSKDGKTLYYGVNVRGIRVDGVPYMYHFVVPEGVEKIARTAFYLDTALRAVTLPSTLTEIGDSAFNGCTSLSNVYNNSSLPLVANSPDYGYVAAYLNGGRPSSQSGNSSSGSSSGTSSSGSSTVWDTESSATPANSFGKVFSVVLGAAAVLIIVAIFVTVLKKDRRRK